MNEFPSLFLVISISSCVDILKRPVQKVFSLNTMDMWTKLDLCIGRNQLIYLIINFKGF